DNDAIVAHRGASHVVAPAPYRDLQVVRAGETHSGDHVRSLTAAGDQSWGAVDGAVPYGSGGVVFGVVGRGQVALELGNGHGRCLRGQVADVLGRRRRHGIGPVGGSLAPRLHHDERRA